MPYGAVRSGDFKLIEFFNDMHVELYNIKDDIGEQHDLAAARPKLAEELRDRLHAWHGGRRPDADAEPQVRPDQAGVHAAQKRRPHVVVVREDVDNP